MEDIPKDPEKRISRGQLAGAVGVLAVLGIVLASAWNGRPDTPVPPEPAATAAPTMSAATAASAALTSATTSPAPTATAGAYCVLGVREGRLAVLSPDRQRVWDLYDVYIVTLPEEEQHKLNIGIPVADEWTLEELLEDYTS